MPGYIVYFDGIWTFDYRKMIQRYVLYADYKNKSIKILAEKRIDMAIEIHKLKNILYIYKKLQAV